MGIPVINVVVAVAARRITDWRISGSGDDCGPREMQPIVEIQIRDLTVYTEITRAELWTRVSCQREEGDG